MLLMEYFLFNYFFYFFIYFFSGHVCVVVLFDGVVYFWDLLDILSFVQFQCSGVSWLLTSFVFSYVFIYLCYSLSGFFYSYSDLIFFDVVFLFFLLFKFELKFFFEYYEWYMFLLPLVGIFFSLCMNFSFLSLSNLYVPGVYCIGVLEAKQWEWECIQFVFLISEFIYLFIIYVLYGDLLEFWGIVFNVDLTSYEDYYEIFSSVEKKSLSRSLSKIVFVEGMDCSCIGSFPLVRDFYFLFYLTSSDVIHSFGIPAFGLKVDCVPGFFSGFGIYWLGGSSGDFYEFSCYEYCGVNHSYMFGSFSLLEVKDFYFLF